MFANQIVSKSATLIAFVFTTFASATALGWQDFPSFEEMMREEDLPQSRRTSNQPVLRPESAWPVTLPSRPAPQQNSVSKRGRFTPSNQRNPTDAKSYGRGVGGSDTNRSSPATTLPYSRGTTESDLTAKPKPDAAFQFRNPFAPRSATPSTIDGMVPLAQPTGSRAVPIRNIGQSRAISGTQGGNFRNPDAGFDRPSSSFGSLPDDSLTATTEAKSGSSSEFDWRTIRVSVGDIILPNNTIFQHTDSVLSIPEETAYLDLIQDIEARKKTLATDPVMSQLSANARMAIWEESFYEFKKARRLAFNNGKLRHESEAARLHNGLKDPFGESNDAASLTSRIEYDLLDDMRRYPDHFTGRPIVLYGVFRPESLRTVSRTDGALDPTITAAEEDPDLPIVMKSSTYGMEYDADNRLTKATVLTGSLTSARSGAILATIDTSGLVTPNQGVQDIQSPWRDMPEFPVLVKGWMVKKFQGDHPLIYCESLRLLSPEAHRTLITSHTYDKERIRGEEKWLYYETMQQLNLTRSDMQHNLARQNILNRIDVLQTEIIDKFRDEVGALKVSLKDRKIEKAELDKRIGSLNRQYQHRKKRYERFKNSPKDFPVYVDLFQNHDEWHGRNVTLTGHVRHAVTYDADPTMYDGRPLHELWLFTEDSQETPAVIVTPELPADFPIGADVVNQVTVTGCVFKRYVYTGQTERRIAPLILAGRIQWSPTVSHVASLVKSGDVSAGSPLAVRAKVLEQKQSGNTALILISLIIIFGLMVLWGRAQREERDRLRLRDRIIDVEEIENGPAPEYASATDEYLNRTR